MAKAKMEIEKKKCLTHEFRVSFPSVFAPKSFKDQEPKYSCVMLFPKKTNLGKKPEGAKFGVSMKEAVFNCLVEAHGPDKSKWPKKMKMPFRDGDEEKSEMEGYEDCIFVTATSKKKPGVVDQKLEHIIDEDQFYAGCYARATLIAFYYDTAGNKGVSFSLQNIQKLKDGKPFGGRKKAEDEFDAVEVDSDDASNYENGSDDGETEFSLE